MSEALPRHPGASSPVSYRLEGRVTFDNLVRLRQEGEAAIAAAAAGAVMHLGGLEQGNSAAVALLMSWFRAADQAGKPIAFVAPPAELVNIIELSGLTEVLPLEPAAPTEET